MIHIPFSVYLLFLAPLTALVVGFCVTRPYKPEWTHVPILLSCAVVTGAAADLAARVYTGWGLDGNLFRWMVAGDWSIPFGVRVDGIGVSVLAMVSLVGALIHVYAAGYMKGEPGFARFFLVFHLFYLSMIGLLVSNNYAQFYLFWELVGVCSYFLIGYWMHKETARRAAMQAFLTLRVADFGLMLAVLLILGLYRNTRFAALYAVAGAMPAGLLALLGVLFLWAATGKSALFPLYFWLPDAMAGPTPVSALMHAATMVTAGIFLLVRSWPLISLVPGLPELIAIVGAATALFAALLASTQTDLKRILAYSTVSHLGLMAFGLGLGQVSAGVFHLVTHGFFKAVLFLCAGILAHAAGKSTVTVDEVGGLWRKMPLTFLCFLAAALSLAGFPFTAGYYSKDAILSAAFHHGGWAIAAGLAIAAGGAFYISRMLFLTFFGDRPEQQSLAHPHEPSPVMGVPVVFLALGALLVGGLGHGIVRVLLSGWPQAVPAPALAEPAHAVSAAALAAAALGAGAAWWLTMSRPSWDWEWRRRRPGLAALFAEDLGWRRVPAACVRAAVWFSDKVGRTLDHDSWDAAIEGSAGACRRLSEAGSRLATGNISDSLWWVMTGAAALLAWAGWRS